MPLFACQLRRPSWFAICTLAALVLRANPAIAAEPTATELSVARRLFDEATELERRGNWELAASKLRDALLVKETPGLRFHLAHCEEKMGLLVEALLDYRRASDLIEAGFKAPDVQRLLLPAQHALEARVPVLVIVAPADVKGVRAELDGLPLGPTVLGRPAPINPGTHRVVVRAPGYQEFVRDVTIREGERRTIEVFLEPAAQPAIAAPPPPARPKALPPSAPEQPTSARTYVLAAESGLALAGLGVGIAFLIVRDTARDRVFAAKLERRELANGDEERACLPASSPPAELRASCREVSDAIADYDRARFISTAGFVTAGVGAAAALLTLVVWPSSGAVPRVETSANGAGLSVVGSF